jgi:hypothetical protein
MTQARVNQLNRLLASLLPSNVPAFLVVPEVRVYLDEMHNYATSNAKAHNKAA